MKRLFLFVFAILLSLSAFAQLEVKEGSFKEVPGFVNINPDDNYQTDDNNLPFAVVKVRTENINEKQRRELTFSGNGGTFIMFEYKDGEVWVYLTAKYADYLKISHPDLSSTEYTFPYDLEPKKGYEMTLVNKFNAVVSGWAALTITTKPEDGAKVLLNGRDVNAITPYSNNMIPSGKYEITVSKYKFATTMKTIDVQDGENKSVEIEMPFAYGKLIVNSEPSGAVIYIDGKDYGVTPAELNNVVVGTHELKFEKSGCASVIKTISLDEKNKLTISEKLQTGREISILTNGTGDQIYIDGNYVGSSPLKATMSFGKHEVKAVRNGKETSKKITVAQTGGDTSVHLTCSKNNTYTVDGVAFEMVAVKGGTFTMGSDDKDAYDWENPKHNVTVSAFMVGKFEVTQKLWTAVMGSNPSYFKGDNLPVETVSWNDVQEFITKLNQKTGQNFRLLTEAEWEYAARGGTITSLYNRKNIIIKGVRNSPNLDKLAWYAGNCGQNYTSSAGCDVSKKNDISGWSEKQYNDNNGGTHPVGLKQPNAYGIYDMLGNVYEWCQDCYGSYSSDSQTNPMGPTSGSSRVIRGGSWFDYARCCRVSYRMFYSSDYRSFNLGFRLAADK